MISKTNWPRISWTWYSYRI